MRVMDEWYKTNVFIQRLFASGVSAHKTICLE